MAGLAGVAAMVRTSRLGNDSSCTGGSREHPWRRLVPTCGLLLSGRCSSVALGSCKLCPGAARLECCAARGRAEATGSKVGGRSAAARAGVAAADVPSASRFISPAAACLVRGFGCGERRGGASRLVEVKPQQRMPVCLQGGGRGAGWCWWECWFDRRGVQARAGAVDVVACMPAQHALLGQPSRRHAAWGAHPNPDCRHTLSYSHKEQHAAIGGGSLGMAGRQEAAPPSQQPPAGRGGGGRGSSGRGASNG